MVITMQSLLGSSPATHNASAPVLSMRRLTARDIKRANLDAALVDLVSRYNTLGWTRARMAQVQAIREEIAALRG